MRFCTGQVIKEEIDMGAWGPRLYQNDVAQDVKDYYKDQLHRGKNGQEITRELIEKNDYILSDEDDALYFGLH